MININSSLANLKNTEQTLFSTIQTKMSETNQPNKHQPTNQPQPTNHINQTNQQTNQQTN